MVDIEKLNGKYQHASPVGQFQTTAGRFACDLLELAELQAKLLKADAKSALSQSIGAATTVAIGSIFLVGCVPVVVFGLASAVAYYCGIEAWVAQLAVSGCLAFLSILCIAIALKALSKTDRQFKRSAEEFSKNIEWTKDVFHGVSSR